MSAQPAAAVSPEELAAYRTDGYLVARGLIPAAEVAELCAHFMAMHADPPRPHYDHPSAAEAGGDPLALYPRVMQPHRYDELAKRYLLDPRLLDILRILLDDEPLAAQSMFYYKPPGARGQALHQDNFYLQVQPGTCLAAWLAVDQSDAENGGLMVVPGTHEHELVCPEDADLSESFVNHLVQPPPDREPVQLVLAPGDVLFFNGNVIHGSEPNRSRDRFRRAFICHYLARAEREVSTWYHPVIQADGRIAQQMGVATGGGPCGPEADRAR